MELTREWTGSRSPRTELVKKYHGETGGILLHAVDICRGAGGCEQQRSADIRVSNLAPGYEHLDGEAFVHTENNQERIRELLETPGHDVELIEAQDCGYDGFGRVVVKSEMLARFWDVSSVGRTLIVDTSDSKPLLRNEPPDGEMMETFREYDIDIVDGSRLE